MDMKDVLIGQVRSHLAANPILPEEVKREINARLAERSEDELRVLLEALAADDKARAAVIARSADELEAQLRGIREENDRILSLFERLVAQAKLSA